MSARGEWRRPTGGESTTPVTITAQIDPEALRTLVAEEVARVLAARAPGASPYLTVPEAAAYLRTTRARVDNLLSDGSLTRVKEGGRTLLHRAEVEARARPERGRWR